MVLQSACAFQNSSTRRRYETMTPVGMSTASAAPSISMNTFLFMWTVPELHRRPLECESSVLLTELTARAHILTGEKCSVQFSYQLPARLRRELRAHSCSILPTATLVAMSLPVGVGRIELPPHEPESCTLPLCYTPSRGVKCCARDVCIFSEANRCKFCLHPERRRGGGARAPR